MRKKGIFLLLLSVVLIIFLFWERDIAFGINSPNMQNEHVKLAKEHLLQITKENHKLGSEGNERVKEYIKNTLNEMGVSYEVLTSSMDYSFILSDSRKDYLSKSESEKKEYDNSVKAYGYDNYDDYITDSYYNYYGLDQVKKNNEDAILVKVDNPQSEQGVMLVCHFDNAPNGVGAADDGVAVASMLEAIRTASTISTLNDMYFLFTDGEEADLFGAKTFLLKYPKLQQTIPLVLNYEARGISGSLVIFETSTNNAGAVNEVLMALPYQYGFSILSDIFKIMPNSTDLKVFMDHGYTGVNFAFAQDSTAYHNLTDSPEYLSDTSFYETVINQQNIVSYFANSDLSKTTSSEDLTFFTLWKGKVITLPSSIVIVFNYLAIIAAFGFFIYLWIKNKFSMKKMLIAFLVMVTSFVSTFLIVFLAELPWTTQFEGHQRHFIHIVEDISLAEEFLSLGKSLGIFLYIAIIIVWGIAITTTILFTKKGKNTLEWNAILLFFSAMQCLVFTILLKGSSYIFAVPLVFSLIALLIRNVKKKWASYIAISTQFISICVLLVPVIALLSVSIQMSLPLWCDAIFCTILAMPLLQTVALIYTSND